MDSKKLAWKIRRHAVEMTHLSHGSHVASCLSVADILAVLYSGVAKVDPKNVKMPDRDRIIMSKGHAGAAIYASLAENGFFEVDELKTHYQNGSRLSGHVSHKLSGIEFSTGSLGHGLPVGAGMCLASKMDGKDDHHVFVIMGDGECDEGSIWEAALFATQFKLDNLIAVIDHNKMQSLTYCEETLKLEPFADKWQAFGWNVLRIDGHDHTALKEAYEKAKALKNGKPTVIIADTVKGKGISFMEMNILWHYRYPQGDEYTAALEELYKIKPDGVVDVYAEEK